jgi:hypothetical protein
MITNISHIGNLWTITDFRLEDKSQIRLKVKFETVCTVANTWTYYKTFVYKKGYKCMNWVFEFEMENAVDIRILKLISEEQLYNAYYNHWQKLNPIRKFNRGIINSELVDFKVKEKTQDKHFAF